MLTKFNRTQKLWIETIMKLLGLDVNVRDIDISYINSLRIALQIAITQYRKRLPFFNRYSQI